MIFPYRNTLATPPSCTLSEIGRGGSPAIAGDILFTKNGMSPKKPWVLMRLSDVQDGFWQEKTLVYARRKG
jgi:hypothetical protein